MSALIEKGAVVLFQGDSITDAGRNREVSGDLGPGYPMIAASLFMASNPELGVTFLNRGISGNIVKNLCERWQEDTVDLKPTVVSIMIGINDTWWGGTSHEDYEAGYREILAATKEKLGAELVLIEPFVMPCAEEYARMRADLDPKIDIVRRLAREFGATLVPADGLFAAACTKTEPTFWTPDGVHLSPAGNAFLAKAWLQAVGAL